MTTPLGIPDLTRPDFFDGQLLDAEDLSSIYDFHRSLRWLHNRALHDWGIAAGFGVTGEKRKAAIVVAPGYGIDCAGRDIVLAEQTTLMVPAVAGAPTGGPVQYFLTASWQADDAIAPAETRSGVCVPGGAVRRPDQPLLRFQNPRDPSAGADRFRRGFDIVLASVLVEDCSLAAVPSLAERRDAHPASQPYVYAASTSSLETGWRFFPVFGAPQGVETVVDTSAAGFVKSPTYTAQVIGNRALAANGPIVDGSVSIVQPTATAFTLRLLLPRNLVMGNLPLNPDAIFVPATLAALQKTLGWSVAWMGIEG